MEKETPADYYKILQVDSKADQDMIERAYRLLAKRYHPDNLETGDVKKFENLITAYRILSDPKERGAYDDDLQAASAYQGNVFSNLPRSGTAERETGLYQAILLMLYFVRRRDSDKPGVGLYEIGRLIDLPDKEAAFHIWYLKEKGWIKRVETGEFAITVEGVDEVIKDGLLTKKNYLLPYFDEESLEKMNAVKTPSE
ncbi:MAG: DnaJ domain-containing protein [Thermodesulfobacteriota bacterium]